MNIHRLLFLLLVFPAMVSAQKKQLQFSHFQTNEGLSQSNVLCILQDSRGFMWFGTREGLNRYDGYNFTVYKNDPKDKNSISGNFISNIIESRDGNIWIATWGDGLCRYNILTNRFTSYKNDLSNKGSLSSNFVNAVAEDKEGNIWAGTEDAGLNMLNIKTGQFVHYRNQKNNVASVSDDFIKTIVQDSEHNLWIGTVNGGLNLFNPSAKTFTRFLHNEKDSTSLSDNFVYTIFEDSKHRLWIGTSSGGCNLFIRNTGKFIRYQHDTRNNNSLVNNRVHALGEDKDHNIWIGTENGGLSVYNAETKTFTNYIHDEPNETSISSNSIYSICRDTKGNMWVGTFNGGVDFSNADTKFTHYKHTSLPNSLSNNFVLYIYEDRRHKMWIGTDGGGLNLFDPQTGSFTHYLHQEGNANSIAGNYILSLCEDSDDNLWIGTVGQGISVYNESKNSFRQFKHDDKDSNSVSSNDPTFILEDKEKNIWIGTYGGGLNLYNPANNSFTSYHYNSKDANSISSNKINSITEDSQGNLWIGTDGKGLNCFNKRTKIFSHYLHSNTKNSIASNNVDVVYEDGNKNLWFSTMNGLSFLNIKTGRFTNYTTADGLPSNNVFGILPDKNNLWISSSRGISKLDLTTKKFTSFDVVDGLQGDEFKEKAYYKDHLGNMYFGGNNGFNVFHPADIKPSPFNPPLLLTGFEIFNKAVPVAADDKDPSPLKQDITKTKSITIPYSSSVINFSFASLNYTSPQKKQYAYMLTPFDKSWNDAGTRHTATYTNLDPGEYVFMVKGLDNEGKWSSTMASINLIVTPPFWLTWWFKLLIALAIASSCIGFYLYRINAVKAQKKVLEKQVQERTQQLVLSTEEERRARLDAEKARAEAEQANKAKSIFLATMSHEIRTPMNGVIGITDLLELTELDTEQRGFTDIIRNCGENLLRTINDILDFSKIESENLELEEADFDLRTCIEEVLDVFSAKAAKTGLDLVYQLDTKVPSQIIGDSLRLRQVLMNLVGNAVKFTQRGEIFVNVRLVNLYDNGNVELAFDVKDTGIGIPANKLERLFKAFSQVDSSTTRKYGGTGLGLVISEKLAKLMGGEISVQSKAGEGTTFTFTIITRASGQITPTYLHNQSPSITKKKILVVEDNTTNLNILKNQLEQWQQVPYLANSAKAAFALLTEHSDFDLIITDMHMPEMNGIQMSTKIRSQYPHIPIVLLASLNDESHKKFPDLFASVLTKPVRCQALQSHIFNQLKKQNNPVTTETKQGHQQFAIETAEHYPLSVLLAEDDVTNQFVQTHILNKIGYHPDIAQTGLEVLQMTETKNYDVILMDVQMPEMDGREVTQIIRQRKGPQPLIVALTANALQGDKEDCLNAGMDEYLSKPISFAKLVSLLQKCVSIIKEAQVTS